LTLIGLDSTVIFSFLGEAILLLRLEANAVGGGVLVPFLPEGGTIFFEWLLEVSIFYFFTGASVASITKPIEGFGVF
jgi:hypothetical protein